MKTTLYKKKYCKMRIESAKKGNSISSFCVEIGIGRRTYYDWLEKHKEFQQAHELSYECELLFYEKRVQAMVSGQELNGFDPKLVNPRLLEFKLRGRFHKQYGDKKSIDISSSDGSMSPGLSDEQKIKMAKEVLNRSER